MIKLILPLLFAALLVPSIPVQAASKCPVPSANVSSGDRGTQVTRLQKFLSAYEDSTLEVTGQFDSATEDAVRSFQKKNGIESSASTFTVGPITRAVMKQVCKDSPSKTAGKLKSVEPSAVISPASLSSRTSNPTLWGTATTKSVYIVITDGIVSDTVLYKSKSIKVKKGTWKITLPQKFEDGVYDVRVLQSKNDVSPLIAGTLTISAEGTPMVSVSYSKPQAGIAFPGTQVPVLTVTVINPSKGRATIEGIWLRPTGNAPVSVVRALTMRVGTNNTWMSFSDALRDYNGRKLILVSDGDEWSLGPRERLVFQFSLELAPTSGGHSGKEIGLDIEGISTSISPYSVTAPIHGAVYTLSK